MDGVHYHPNIKQKDKRLAQQKEGGKQGCSPCSFYQKATSLQTSPRREEEQEKELKENILPKLQDPKNQKGCHGQCLQHGQKPDRVQGQRGTKNDKTPFPKEISISPDVFNTLKEPENSTLPLKASTDKSLTGFLKQAENLNKLYPETSQKMMQMKILEICGGELEHSLGSRCLEPCSTEDYINALEDIVARPKIGRTWKTLDYKISNKPVIREDKPREPFQ
ncbi:hypothetical protein O181_045246 [Austropuccinia psidii MF-1]|uniref:Uncharacterized protein n=1 Tax=Austropuccinia psidii MF-1 TaxID=1389203 RepID=A0A9Q3DJV4_9BASI|nr:hypothetical protein [Austropuccinia psidii MF-1]